MAKCLFLVANIHSARMKPLAFVLIMKNPLTREPLTHSRSTSPLLLTPLLCASLRQAVMKIPNYWSNRHGWAWRETQALTAPCYWRRVECGLAESVSLTVGNLCHFMHQYVTSASTRRRRIADGQDVAYRPNSNGKWLQVDNSMDRHLVRTKCSTLGVINLGALWLIQMGIESVAWMLRPSRPAIAP